MILVTGAGGKTGRAVIQALSRTTPVTALVYREEQIPAARSLGAERVVAGDVRDRSVLRRALEQAAAVYHISPNMHPEEQAIGQTMLESARAAGVERFVYHSVLRPQAEAMPHHWQKLRVEQMVLESGLAFTILQPAPYMQNLLAGWQGLVEDGELRVPYSIRARFSFVDLEDVAEASRRVLTDPRHAFAVYELAGTGPETHADAAAALSRILNRDVRARQESIGDWRIRTGFTDGYAAQALVRMFEYYDRYGLPGNPGVLRWILNREPVSLESFFERMLRQADAVH